MLWIGDMRSAFLQEEAFVPGPRRMGGIWQAACLVVRSLGSGVQTAQVRILAPCLLAS